MMPRAARSRAGKELEVFATTKTLLACVSEANFPQLLEVDANVRRHLTEAKRRLLISYRWARVLLFEMPDNTLNKFAELATLPLDPGSTVETNSADTRGMYLIADGEVECSKRSKSGEDGESARPSSGRSAMAITLVRLADAAKGADAS